MTTPQAPTADVLRAVIVAGDRLAKEHGESCDCDTCLIVQPLADAALAAIDARLAGTTPDQERGA